MSRRAVHAPVRATGLALATILAAFCLSAAPAAAIDRFERCTPETADDAGLRLTAERLGAPGEYSERWLEVQFLSHAIEVAMRASSARRDYFGMGFDPDRERTFVYVRNRDHDAAIRRCARELGIARHVRIVVHRWSKGQLLGAIKKTIRAAEDLYDAGLFECSYGSADRFNIEVYRGATDAQVARIRKAAKATKVAFRLERVDRDRPRGVLQ